MPRSGKERKTRRRERRRTEQVEADTFSDSPAIQGGRGQHAPTDSTNGSQRFPMHLLTESPDGGENLTMIELAVRAVGEGLRSTDPRIRNIAAKTALQMEKLNQADEHHLENLEIKKAALEQRGGHLNDKIPTGVVLLERPCTDVESWLELCEEAEKNPVTGNEPIEFAD